jgi:hypothetical protein
MAPLPEFKTTPNPDGTFMHTLTVFDHPWEPPESLTDAYLDLARMESGVSVSMLLCAWENDADGWVVEASVYSGDETLPVAERWRLEGALGEALALSRLHAER